MAKPSGTITQTHGSRTAVTFDADEFDFLINTDGVLMQHWRAMKCPVGLSDPNDHRTSHAHHKNCSNGFIYKHVGDLRVLFSGNNSSERMKDQGFVDGSSAQVTFPRTYETADKPVHIAPFDRLYLAHTETEVPNWETVSSVAGPERLEFPVKRVEHAIDDNGREYDSSLYYIKDGKMHWKGQDRPHPGQVLTVWYTYQPYWYVTSLIHQVRMGITIDPLEGAKVVRMPYAAIIQRENVFKATENDILTEDDSRKQDPPAERDFGSNS